MVALVSLCQTTLSLNTRMLGLSAYFITLPIVMGRTTQAPILGEITVWA